MDRNNKSKKIKDNKTKEKKIKVKRKAPKNNKGLFLAFGLLIAFFVITRIAIEMADMEKRVYHGLGEEAEESNYPVSNIYEDYFFIDNFSFRSYDDGETVSKRGIDVSQHQGEIDWEKVKRAGVEFAYIRVGYRTTDNGILKEDIRFRENIQGALDNDIEVGVYFFSQAITLDEAKDEAQFVADMIRGYNVTLPVAFDMEDVAGSVSRIDDLDRDQVTEFADAFCAVIENYGYDSIIYGNPSWLIKRLNLLKIHNRKIWLAHYAESTYYPFRYEIWQYSESGTVDGIQEACDLNIMFVRNQ